MLMCKTRMSMLWWSVNIWLLKLLLWSLEFMKVFLKTRLSSLVNFHYCYDTDAQFHCSRMLIKIIVTITVATFLVKIQSILVSDCKHEIDNRFSSIQATQIKAYQAKLTLNPLILPNLYFKTKTILSSYIKPQHTCTIWININIRKLLCD